MSENPGAADLPETEFVTIRFESPAFPGDDIRLRKLVGQESISKPFDYELYLLAKTSDTIDSQALLDNPARLVFQRTENSENAREVYGMIATVDDCFISEWGFTGYRVRFVPRIWRLSLQETLDIFMELSVPQIIRKVLTAARFSEGIDFEIRLLREYPVRDFVVQYKESDLGFLSRLTEHLGISYFFEHRDGRDVVVFVDENLGYRPIGEDNRVLYDRGQGKGVFTLAARTQAVANRVVIRDYNYRNPSMDVMAEESIPQGTGGTVVEYGAHCKDPEEAAVLAKVRAQEIMVGRRVFRGESHEHRFAPGHTFDLEQGPGGDIPLLLMDMTVTAVQSVFHKTDGTEEPFKNEFRAIHKDTTFRPPRLTPKPRVHGTLTGIVEPGDGKYADVDEGGRYRVKFLFDTAAPGERKASKPVRMAQPHAGPGYGMHFPLRPYTEVILTCIDGDPDRPIIAGAVPNPQTQSPVVAGNQTKNVIRTGGANEIEIDDTEGSERIKMTTPNGQTVLQLGAANSPNTGGTLATADHLALGGGLGINVAGGVVNHFSLTKSVRSNGVYTIADDVGGLDVPIYAASLLGSAAKIGKSAYVYGMEVDKTTVANARVCWDARNESEVATAQAKALDEQLAQLPGEQVLAEQLASAETSLAAAGMVQARARKHRDQALARPVDPMVVAGALALDEKAYSPAPGMSNGESEVTASPACLVLKSVAASLRAEASKPAPDYGSTEYANLRESFAVAALNLESQAAAALRGRDGQPGHALQAQIDAGKALEQFMSANTTRDAHGQDVPPDLGRPENAPLLRVFNTLALEYSQSAQAVNRLNRSHLAIEDIVSRNKRDISAMAAALAAAEHDQAQADIAAAMAQETIDDVQAAWATRTELMDQLRLIEQEMASTKDAWEKQRDKLKCDILLEMPQFSDDDAIKAEEERLAEVGDFSKLWDSLATAERVLGVAMGIFPILVNLKAWWTRWSMRDTANRRWEAGRPKGAHFGVAPPSGATASKVFKPITEEVLVPTVPSMAISDKAWPKIMGISKGLHLNMFSEVADKKIWNVIESTGNLSATAAHLAQLASDKNTLVGAGVHAAVTSENLLTLTGKKVTELYGENELLATSMYHVDVRAENAKGVTRISAGENVLFLSDEKIELNNKSGVVLQLTENGVIISMGGVDQSLTINKASNVTINASEPNGQINLNATGVNGGINLIANQAGGKIALVAPQGEINLSAKTVSISASEGVGIASSNVELVGAALALKAGPLVGIVPVTPDEGDQVDTSYIAARAWTRLPHLKWPASKPPKPAVAPPTP